MIVAISESWWARYLPQTYLITIFALIITLIYIKNNKGIIFKIAACAFSLLILANMYFFVEYNVIKSFKEFSIISQDINRVKALDDGNDLLEVAVNFPLEGAIYNYYDVNHRVIIVDTLSDPGNLMGTYIYPVSIKHVD